MGGLLVDLLHFKNVLHLNYCCIYQNISLRSAWMCLDVLKLSYMAEVISYLVCSVSYVIVMGAMHDAQKDICKLSHFRWKF